MCAESTAKGGVKERRISSIYTSRQKVYCLIELELTLNPPHFFLCFSWFWLQNNWKTANSIYLSIFSYCSTLVWVFCAACASVHVKKCCAGKKEIKCQKVKRDVFTAKKTCGDLWFGVVEGRDGGLEGVKVSHLHHMYREAVPLHDC